jgi:hypothetical protein
LLYFCEITQLMASRSPIASASVASSEPLSTLVPAPTQLPSHRRTTHLV